MDARDKLRRYLEQRRELGESELILDQLTVAEVLDLVGAQPVDKGGATPVDWRSALRASGVPGRDAGDARVEPPGSAARTVPRGDHQAPSPSVDRDERVVGEQAPAAKPTADFSGEAIEAAKSSTSMAAKPLDQLPPGIVVGVASHELFGGPTSEFATLDELAAAVASCRKCPLYRDARNPVPGEGNPQAELVCVGEAPGAVEDETGRPFVGQAGKLLDRILGAIELSRNDVFICNVLKHRPPGNRNPMPHEVDACSPYLVRQIELIRPRVIVALGTFAAQTLLSTREPIGKLRGRIHHYYGVPLVVTYHPAALLRNPGWKRPTWDDVQLARRLLDRPGGS